MASRYRLCLSASDLSEKIHRGCAKHLPNDLVRNPGVARVKSRAR